MIAVDGELWPLAKTTVQVVRLLALGRRRGCGRSGCGGRAVCVVVAVIAVCLKGETGIPCGKEGGRVNAGRCGWDVWGVADGADHRPPVAHQGPSVAHQVAHQSGAAMMRAAA